MPNQVDGALLRAPCPVPSCPACEPNTGSVHPNLPAKTARVEASRHCYAIKWRLVPTCPVRALIRTEPFDKGQAELFSQLFVRGRENGGIRRVGGGVDDQRCADGGTGLQPRYHALMKLLAGSCRRELLRQRLDLME